jgi:hypothetical protein
MILKSLQYLQWGIAGMVLFLPFAAMLKVICEEFDQLKPIAMLISNDISGDNNEESKTSKWIEKIKGWFKNNNTPDTFKLQ